MAAHHDQWSVPEMRANEPHQLYSRLVMTLAKTWPQCPSWWSPPQARWACPGNHQRDGLYLQIDEIHQVQPQMAPVQQEAHMGLLAVGKDPPGDQWWHQLDLRASAHTYGLPASDLIHSQCAPPKSPPPPRCNSCEKKLHVRLDIWHRLTTVKPLHRNTKLVFLSTFQGIRHGANHRSKQGSTASPSVEKNPPNHQGDREDEPWAKTKTPRSRSGFRNRS